VGIVSGASEPNQWKDAGLWKSVLSTHRIIVSTPQVLLDAMRHGYVSMGKDISLLVFDEAHHADKSHPYSLIMQEFYHILPPSYGSSSGIVRPKVLGLTASPSYGSNLQYSLQ
jgi:endoribonuclease Dicer